MIDTLIFVAFNRHCDRLHRAEYEACGNWLCRFAYWVERVFRPEYEVQP